MHGGSAYIGRGFVRFKRQTCQSLCLAAIESPVVRRFGGVARARNRPGIRFRATWSGYDAYATGETNSTLTAAAVALSPPFPPVNDILGPPGAAPRNLTVI